MVPTSAVREGRAGGGGRGGAAEKRFLLLPGSGGALPRKPEVATHGNEGPRTFWIESLFDVNGPYLDVLVLPALTLFALGIRSQAALFGLGAVRLAWSPKSGKTRSWRRCATV